MIEFSLIIPVLNEEETLGICIKKAQTFFNKKKINFEIIIADNGSIDNSAKIAKKSGARVVHVKERGYGAAIQGGFEKAKGKYLLMGDADDSYDFSKLDDFVRLFRQGKDFVIGNRFSGKIMPGAMPGLNQYLGNPALSFLGRLFFNSNIGDFHCGLRGLTKELFNKLDLNTTGMEYASEMVIKASILRVSMADVPIVYYKDGRKRKPNLRRWRDGWRHLRFLLLFAPQWLYLYPGTMLFLVGFLLFVLTMPGQFSFFGVILDVHTLLVASAFLVIGVQIILFGFFSRIYIEQFNLLPRDGTTKFSKQINFEYGLIAGLISLLLGFLIFGSAFYSWYIKDFGPLDYSITMRAVIPALLFMQLGIQLFFNSFFMGSLTLNRK